MKNLFYFYWMLLDVIGKYRSSLDVIGCYWMLLDVIHILLDDIDDYSYLVGYE
jgi:hypothetical protein